jgi:hypothetical protein
MPKKQDKAVKTFAPLTQEEKDVMIKHLEEPDEFKKKEELILNLIKMQEARETKMNDDSVPVYLTDVIAYQVNDERGGYLPTGEFSEESVSNINFNAKAAATESEAELVGRMTAYVQDLIDHAMQAYTNEKHHVFRLLMHEFSLYPHRSRGPLTREGFRTFANNIENMARRYPANFHFLVATVPVMVGENEVQNMGMYVQCGETPIINVFSKAQPSSVDLVYPGTQSCDLRCMSSIPTIHNLPAGNKSAYVLYQPVAAMSPLGLYFVDRSRVPPEIKLITNGCKALLADGCELKMTSVIPTPADLLLGRNSEYLLYQDPGSSSPIQLYFVDRTSAKPTVTRITRGVDDFVSWTEPLLAKQDPLALNQQQLQKITAITGHSFVHTLFPSVVNHQYKDMPDLSPQQLLRISEITGHNRTINRRYTPVPTSREIKMFNDWKDRFSDQHIFLNFPGSAIDKYIEACKKNDIKVSGNFLKTLTTIKKRLDKHFYANSLVAAKTDSLRLSKHAGSVAERIEDQEAERDVRTVPSFAFGTEQDKKAGHAIDVAYGVDIVCQTVEGDRFRVDVDICLDSILGGIAGSRAMQNIARARRNETTHLPVRASHIVTSNTVSVEPDYMIGETVTQADPNRTPLIGGIMEGDVPLEGCGLCKMNDIPTLSNLPSDPKSAYVLYQPDGSNLPTALYFVDNSSGPPVITSIVAGFSRFLNFSEQLFAKTSETYIDLNLQQLQEIAGLTGHVAITNEDMNRVNPAFGSHTVLHVSPKRQVGLHREEARSEIESQNTFANNFNAIRQYRAQYPYDVEYTHAKMKTAIYNSACSALSQFSFQADSEEKKLEKIYLNKINRITQLNRAEMFLELSKNKLDVMLTKDSDKLDKIKAIFSIFKIRMLQELGEVQELELLEQKKTPTVNPIVQEQNENYRNFGNDFLRHLSKLPLHQLQIFPKDYVVANKECLENVARIVKATYDRPAEMASDLFKELDRYRKQLEKSESPEYFNALNVFLQGYNFSFPEIKAGDARPSSEIYTRALFEFKEALEDAAYAKKENKM